MDIEAIGERMAWTLIDRQLVYDPSDLYALTRDQLLALDRMANKSVQNVLDNIAANPGQALRMTKRLLREAQTSRLDTLLELAAAYQALTHHSAEHAEAVNAFLNSKK